MKLINNDYEKKMITSTFVFILFINITFLLRKYKIKKKNVKSVMIFNLFY